jgi:hypothetical protein
MKTWWQLRVRSSRESRRETDDLRENHGAGDCSRRRAERPSSAAINESRTEKQKKLEPDKRSSKKIGGAASGAATGAGAHQNQKEILRQRRDLAALEEKRIRRTKTDRDCRTELKKNVQI